MAKEQAASGGLTMYGEHWRPRPVPVDADLANFRNNGISSGFDGYSWRKDANGKKTLANKAVELAYNIIASVVGTEFIDAHYPTGPGNPPTVTVDGRVLTSSDLTAVYNAWQLCRWLDEPRHIVEIGPGYGALASVIRRIYPEVKMTLVDLPERHQVLEYYLNETVGLDGIEITTELPSDADVVIALRCLMEMPVAEVQRYMDWIQSRPSMEYLYIINRYLKRNALKSYPFDKKWAPVVSQCEVPFRAMHELVLMRTPRDSDHLHMLLQTLPPYVANEGKTLIDLQGEYQFFNLDTR